jgi:hypothetical protein
MRKKPTRIVAPAEYKLPQSFHRQIGHIIVRWAYFEQCVRRLVWDVLGVDDKTGRIAVRDARIDDRIEMIGDIAHLRKIKIDSAALKSLEARANEVLRWRDLLAHGIWISKDRGWLLQMTAGKYPKNYAAEHRKRRVNPEGVNVTIEGLHNVSHAIEILIDDVLKLRDDLWRQLQSSPDKHRKQ